MFHNWRCTRSWGRGSSANTIRCRANSAHVRQSRPDSGLGFKVEVLNMFSIFAQKRTDHAPTTLSMQKPIVGTGFKSGTDNICSDCLALLNEGKPSKKVLTANLPSRIALTSFNLSTQNVPPHTFDFLHAREDTLAHSRADAIQCDVAAESVRAHRHRGKWLEAER